MKKITINMLSSADKVDGQGVGSAYLEQVSLVKEGASDIFDVMINSNKKADIIHHHTIDLDHFFKMQMSDAINVAYVHFLPTTLDGSIKLPKAIFPVFKKYVISFYNSADYLVVVNPSFIKELVSCGIDEEKIIYIPNYVSKENFYIMNSWLRDPVVGWASKGDKATYYYVESATKNNQMPVENSLGVVMAMYISFE